MANANQIQLHQAISTGNVAALNQTIRRMGAFRDGTNVNLAFDMHREAPQTPLYYAIKYNKPQIVEALIKAGAKVNQVDSEGNTPLYYAIKNKCYDIMGTLVKKGANLELTNDAGESARTLAAAAGFKFSDNQPDTRFSRFMKSFLSAFIYNFFASIGLLSAVAPNTIEAASVKNHTSTDETTGAILSVLASKNDGRPVEKNQPLTDSRDDEKEDASWSCRDYLSQTISSALTVVLPLCFNALMLLALEDSTMEYQAGDPSTFSPFN